MTCRSKNTLKWKHKPYSVKARFQKTLQYKKQAPETKIQKGNILVPDINRFIGFCTKDRSGIRNVITQRLLTAVMESNTLRTQISEVEGDPLHLYKYVRKLTPDEILPQYEGMLLNFETEIAIIRSGFRIDLELS